MSGGQRQRLALACAVSTGAAAAARRRADQPAQPRGPRPRPRADPRARRRPRHHHRRGHPPARGRGDLPAHRHHEGRPGRRRGPRRRGVRRHRRRGRRSTCRRHLAAEWPQGTLVRIEPEEHDRLVVSRPADSARGAGGRVSDLEVQRRHLRRRAHPARRHRPRRSAAGEVTALSGPERLGQDHAALDRRRAPRADARAPRRTTAARCGRAPATRGPEVAFVLQVYGLVPILSARENVSIALRARGVDPREADERAEAALARFHIADLGDRQVEELSGGQMQRVACARGLRRRCRASCWPTSRPPSSTRATAAWCSTSCAPEAARGAVVVVATHDPAVVDACDRHFVLDEGRLVHAPTGADDPQPPRRLESPGCPPDPGRHDHRRGGGRRRGARLRRGRWHVAAG